MNKGTVLVVEDTLESLKLLSDILSAEGYRVMPANSGELALVAVALSTPELILLDIRMPGMDGFEVLQRLKADEQTRHIPVIILSSITETDQRVQGLRLGAVDFVSKPFQREELLARVQTHVELTRTRARTRQISAELRQLNVALEMRVTERTALLMSANAALLAASQDLERTNQELEQFAYVASHDLQEPLRMVVGFVQLLEKRLAGKLDAETAEFMGFTIDGAQRMQRLIQDILAYSRISSRGVPFETVDSAVALRLALEALGSQIALTGAVVDVATLPMVLVDQRQLVQLFQNLIGNALKFCRENPPQVRVEANREGDFWRFVITDNGIGIAPEDRERIFCVFQRLHTRKEYEGTGIGLAICNRIVKRHGGNIGVLPPPGAGSAVWFTLPVETIK